MEAQTVDTPGWPDTRPADLDGYESKMIHAGGVPTRYYDVGHGHPLVMTHGAGWRGESSGNTFVPTFPFMSKKYRVIAPDKLASGLTGNPSSPEGYTIEAQVAHMTAFIKELELDEFLLVGQSRGAYLAGRIALENPDLVRGLVLVDSGTLGPAVGDLAARRAKLFEGRGVVDKNMDDFESLRSGLRFQHERLSYSHDHITDDFIDAKMYMESTDKSRQAVRDLEAGGQQVFLASLAAQKKDTLTWIERGGLQMPVLVYWGKDDPSALLDVGLGLFQLISKENDRTRMLIANRAGHFHYREHPEEFSYNVANFFDHWCKN